MFDLTPLQRAKVTDRYLVDNSTGMRSRSEITATAAMGSLAALISIAESLETLAGTTPRPDGIKITLGDEDFTGVVKDAFRAGLERAASVTPTPADAEVDPR